MDTAREKRFGGAACDEGWAEGEFEGVALGDARLERRLIRVVEGLSSQPEYPVNQACEDAAATKAAYRLFDNDKVSAANILTAHRAKTSRRMRQEPVVLAIQDTTFFNLTGHKKTRGLGPIGDRSGKLQGRIVKLEPLGQTPRLLGRKRFIKGSWPVRVQIVQHDRDPFRCRIMPVGQIAHGSGP